VAAPSILSGVPIKRISSRSSRRSSADKMLILKHASSNYPHYIVSQEP